MKSILSAALVFTILGVSAIFAGENRLVVHEWGTFTSLQDEQGKAIAGINTDDEPVPHFVHRLGGFLLIKPDQVWPPNLYQGAPHCHPDVTMRLETPVVYFHRADDSAPPEKIGVHVAFRGGWLTEYYPWALASNPGLGKDFNFGPITASTIGTLDWSDLRVGGDGSGPATTHHVWTSPRAVDAATVTTSKGESERFLFYRGVGHVDAPLRVSRSRDGSEFVIRSQIDRRLRSRTRMEIRDLWLVEIRAGGTAAFRPIEPIELTRDSTIVLARTPASFEEAEFTAENVIRLRRSLHAALLEDGLFADEADALLNTWELSYFKSPGLRLFFMVPRAWTDHVLPIRFSKPVTLQRAMVGRIELVTKQQRDLLKTLANGPALDFQLFRLTAREQWEASPGPASLPAPYRAYFDLGRFRNALILDEQEKRPTPTLMQFIKNLGLSPFRVVDPSQLRTPGTDPVPPVTF